MPSCITNTSAKMGMHHLHVVGDCKAATVVLREEQLCVGDSFPCKAAIKARQPVQQLALSDR